MPYNLSEAFEAIENELISSMMRNLKRHQAEETAQGFEWEQWQALQLQALEDYRRRNMKKFPPRFNKLNAQIEEALRTSYKGGRTAQERKILKAIQMGFKTSKMPYSGDMELEGGFFGVNDRKLDALINAVDNDMSRAEYAVLRRADDQYRQTIFNAQVYANSGAGTYKKAVDMATRDFLRAGLDCVEYKNGSRHTLEDYADMAIRTANKRAYLQGEGSMRDEWGIPTVIMNKRSCPCPLCAPFVGKVFIDDVWSGGGKDGISPVTGIKYPLLSDAIAQGLYHPRCKDVHSTYFEGISTPPEGSQYTADELDEMAQKYEAQQKQGYCERQEKRYSRMSKYSLDEENQRMYGARAKEWGEKAEGFGNVINSFEKPVDNKVKPYTEVQDEYFKAATPGKGILSCDEGCTTKLYENEVEFAEWLHKTLGGDLHVFEEIHENKRKNPDYLWNGKLWDLKTITSEKAANTAIKRGQNQIKNNPGGVMLDFRDYDFSDELLIEVINKRMQWYKDNAGDVMIVSKGKIYKILRYKK